MLPGELRRHIESIDCRTPEVDNPLGLTIPPSILNPADEMIE
jgi:hypothetical protein